MYETEIAGVDANVVYDVIHHTVCGYGCDLIAV